MIKTLIYLIFAASIQAQVCQTVDCWINAMPRYAQRNTAFPGGGSQYCAPTTTAMMIQAQLNKAGVTVTDGSWTARNFFALYTTQVTAEATEMQTNPNWGTSGYNVWKGFNHPLQDVASSDGSKSVYEEDSNYPTQRTLADYKTKLKAGYSVGLLIDYLKERRIYDGFPSCRMVRYEYYKSGGHFVAVRGYDGDQFFINNPQHAGVTEKRQFGVIPNTKNGLPVYRYLENNWYVPDSMTMNYIGPIGANPLPATCSSNNVNCKCDHALGLTKTPVYAATVFDTLYQAH